MPRTSAVEIPGCPPLRALTTDVLGLVKVVEARGKAAIPKVVETWGPPDASRGILAASFADDQKRPLIAVARKNNLVEIINPLNGHSLAAIKVSESSSEGLSVEDDPVVGLHLFKTKRNELSSKSNMLLICTEKGKASLRPIATTDASLTTTTDSQSTWPVSTAGKVICSAVTANEKYALFGGKGIELNVWDLDNCSKTWTSKAPPRNNLGLFSPTWFTAATFLSKEDHHIIAAGTNNHQVRLYDISAQRRPVISISFRETPIKAVTADPDGHTVYVGTSSGDLASFDIRTGKLLGCFIGKCSGSIRSIARHPELPIIASCGLDRYLRIWSTETRQLLSAVFLKQHLTNVSIDSHFSYEEPAGSADQPNNLKAVEHTEADNIDDDDDDDELSFKKSKKPKKREKNKGKKNNKRAPEEIAQEDDSFSLREDDTNKLEPPSEGKGRSKKIKKNKSKGAQYNN